MKRTAPGTGTWRERGGGLLVLAVSAAALAYSWRAAAAHAVYGRAKFLTPIDDVKTILRLCDRAHRLYRFNYFNCSWAADRAFDSVADLDLRRARVGLALSREWCERGLELNPRSRPLQLRMAEILERESPAEAVAWWRAYVDRHFWETFNHAVLARLHAAAGNRAAAEQELGWVRGSPHYERARAEVDALAPRREYPENHR